MNFYILMLFGVIGTIISVYFFVLATKIGFVPEGWRFYEDGQGLIMRTNNRFYIYFPRFILGGLVLPSLYLLIHSILGFTAFNSTFWTAVIILMLEAPILIIGILSGVMKQPPQATIPLIVVTLLGHLNLGIWIGIATTI